MDMKSSSVPGLPKSRHSSTECLLCEHIPCPTCRYSADHLRGSFQPRRVSIERNLTYIELWADPHIVPSAYDKKQVICRAA